MVGIESLRVCLKNTIEMVSNESQKEYKALVERIKTSLL